MLQAPVDLNATLGLGCGCHDSGLGDASCKGNGILLPAIAGAVAVYFIPPILAGFFGGMKDEVSDYRSKRGVYARRK